MTPFHIHPSLLYATIIWHHIIIKLDQTYFCDVFAFNKTCTRNDRYPTVFEENENISEMPSDVMRHTLHLAKAMT